MLWCRVLRFMERGEAHWLSRCLFVVDDAWDLGSLSTPGKTLFSTTAGTVRAHKEREAGAPNVRHCNICVIKVLRLLKPPYP